MRPVTIVVPIYGAWPSLRDCIKSIKTNVDLSKHRVLFANDGGPDGDLIEANVRQAIAGEKGMDYFRNPKNLGFIGNCNRAVTEIDKTDNDILLLNSDTVITAGAVEELASLLAEESTIGAASPRSNNASLTTVPISTASQKGISHAKAYKVYQKIKSDLPRYYEAPTAHGFCILIRRTLINKLGLFDPIFGKGYGEEVDFCQRIRKAGYKCAIANQSFVFHMEAKSFSMATKQQLLETNNKIIWKRYPKYRQEVRDYMDNIVISETNIEKKHGVRYGSNLLKKIVKRLKRVVRK